MLFKMAGKGVSFIKPQTPAFIAQFKQNVGYKEAPDIETKLKEARPDDIDDVDREDEKPAVVLAEGVNRSEADAFLATLEEEKIAAQKESEREDEQSSNEPGKILFKKPEKRKRGKGEYDDDKDKNNSSRKVKKRSSMKKVKDRNLLSFDDEEDDG